MDLGSLVVSDPPDGFSVSSDPAAPNGEYALVDVFTMLGVKESDLGTSMRNARTYGRTWDGPNFDRLFVLLIETPTPADAAAVLEDGLASPEEHNAVRFDSGIDHATGLVMDQSGIGVRIVVWQQGRYFIEVGSGSKSAADGKAAVLDLANRQIELLRSELQIEVGVVPAADDGATSIVTLLGRITGGMFAMALIAGVIILISRRGRSKGLEAEWSPQALGYFPPQGPTLPPPPPGPFDSPPPPPYGQ